MKTQRFTSANQWYSLEYPRTWEMEIVENIPAFYDGVFSKGGVLQVFSVRKGELDKIPEEILKTSPFLKGENLEQKMELFLGSQGIAREEIKTYRRGPIQMTAEEYYVESRFYMAAMLEREDIFLLALYNSPETPEDDEAAVIGEIIRSIEIH